MKDVSRLLLLLRADGAVFLVRDVQGRRKQIFSAQPNQLQKCVYREFKMMSSHKSKLLCKAQSACILC